MKSQTFLFFDFDGTLYDSGFMYLFSPYYNIKTRALIKKNDYKFIITTGRASWGKVGMWQRRLLGLPQPDILITGAGSNIYYKSGSKFEEDVVWKGIIEETALQVKGTSVENKWEKPYIINHISKIIDKYNLRVKSTRGKFMIRLSVRNMPIGTLLEVVKEINEVFTKGIKVIFTEKRYETNTAEVFSGYIKIIPEMAGKGNSARYILKKYIDKEKLKPNALFFGDAMVDVDMLSLKLEDLVDKHHSYGVALTPYANQSLVKDIETERLKVLKGGASKAIYLALKEYTADK